MQYNDIAEKDSNSEHKNIKGWGRKKRWAQKWHVDSHHFGITFLSTQKWLNQRQNTS